MKKHLIVLICLSLVAVGGLLFLNSRELKIRQSKVDDLEPTPIVRQIRIVAVGDISLAREVNYQIISKNNPYFPFEKVKQTISSADIAIGNLESPVIDNCPIVRSGFQFCGQPENIRGLKHGGFDAMSLANNHINNYGPEGVKQTIRTLIENDIGYFYNDETWYQEIYQTKFGFLGFDDTLERVKGEKLKVKIKEIKENIDILVVNFHWGDEYQKQPNERQKELAKLAIDAGADIIIGHHPHVIQPLEYYQTKPIFYSLGNFVFDQMWSEETKTGAIGLITIENNQVVDSEIKKVYMSTCCQPELIE